MADRAARFRELIDAHYESLYRFAFRLSGSAADADDLCQETFAKALSRYDQLRDAGAAKSWLFQILRNEYLLKLRDAKRIQGTITNLDEIAEAERSDPPLPVAVDSTTLQAALDELEESFRTPLILYYFEDFSYREIAEQLELPIGTVMSRLARAKGYLRRRLGGTVEN